MSELIWSKGIDLDTQMHQLTVGNDHIIDRKLVVWDCIGSAAHGRMLKAIGILEEEDLKKILQSLKNIYSEARDKGVEIPSELEDAHNFLENSLVQEIGEAGLKIHAGRSRNDQVLVTTRLHLRHSLLHLLERLVSSVIIVLAKYNEIGHVEFPGYTHMQPAMPSSITMWLHSQAEALLECLEEGLSLFRLINRNPLGVSAGFGSNIPLDKELTTRLLGFERYHRSPLDGNNSRGRYESRLAHFAQNIVDITEKAACDLMLYTMKEFGFVKLPVSMTTGSSIMPQKKNYDIIELLRGRGAKVRAAAQEIDFLRIKLTSSYNRDFQYIKEPTFRLLEEMEHIFDMFDLVFTHLEVDKEKCEKALTDEIYSTYYANNLAMEKLPYRTAYRQVAEAVLEGRFSSKQYRGEFQKILDQTDREKQHCEEALEKAKAELETIQNKLSKVYEEIFL